MLKLKGIPASRGIAIGPCYVYQTQEIKAARQAISSPAEEIQRLQPALDQAGLELGRLKEKALAETGASEAQIFEAHALFLEDPALISVTEEGIRNEIINVELSWQNAIEMYAGQMEAMEDEYFRARAADIRDVGRRVLRILMDIPESDLSQISQPSIISAHDLTPSDTVRMDKKNVLGFCTVEGGPTSHTAILAKALGLPAVVGAGAAIMNQHDKQCILDGSTGSVISDPDEEILQKYTQRRQAEERLAGEELKQAHAPAITKDDHEVEIVANVGSPADAHNALEQGAEGIGLLRTEFLYLERNIAPNEEEQLAAYNSILDVMGTRPVVVRTLDVGGDKEIPYIDLGEEANPFLGWRAIRMCLDQPDFFKIQLRALLRASVGHDLRIMFPMIATISEVRQARVLLEEARTEVLAAGHVVADGIQIGIMVEIPSVAIMADRFAEEVDFFSVGTNDLTQYTLAAERTNERVAHLGDACHPAVLRQIAQVIKAAHEQGIWVGVCGELAGDSDAIPVLLGLGLDEFSMSPSLIPHAKTVIRTWDMPAARELAQAVLQLRSAADVRAHVRAQSGD